MLEDRAERNRVRHTILKAEKDEIITKDEVAFIIGLIENGRKEIEKKVRALTMLKGELNQLKQDREVLTTSMKEGPLAGKKTKLVGLISTKFDSDIDKKKVQIDAMRGEVAQLKSTEQAIVGVIENLSKAKERDIARQETSKKLREAREVEKERRKQKKESLTKEQADRTEETKEDVAKKSGIHDKNKKDKKDK